MSAEDQGLLDISCLRRSAEKPSEVRGTEVDARISLMQRRHEFGRFDDQYEMAGEQCRRALARRGGYVPHGSVLDHSKLGSQDAEIEAFQIVIGAGIQPNAPRRKDRQRRIEMVRSGQIGWPDNLIQPIGAGRNLK